MQLLRLTVLLACLAWHMPAAAVAKNLEQRVADLEQQLALLQAALLQQQALSEEALAPVRAAARAPQDTGPAARGTKFSYGGYVQLDTVTSRYSGGKPAALLEDIFVPSLVPVEAGNGRSDSYSSTNMHAKTSRFHFGTATDTHAGRISSHIELDFALSAQGDERVSNSFSSRIRHAFVTWDYGQGKSLMAGQNWSTFMNTAAVPDLIDLVGPVGTVFERQAQLRWTTGALQFALENPVTRVDLPTGDARIDEGQLLPDVVARYNGRHEGLSWSLAGLLRRLGYETRSSGNTEEDSDERFAYGMSLAGRWALGDDDLRFMLNYGDALGRYMGLNAFDDGYIDSAGRLQTLRQWGALLAYRHQWSPRWRSNVSLSLAAANNPSAVDFANAGGLAKGYRSLHMNLHYLPAPNLQLGGEFLYGYKELEDGRDGDLTRLQFAVKYAF